MEIPLNDENSVAVDSSQFREVATPAPKRLAHQERVVQEKQELDDKLKKLNEFLLTETFHNLSDAEQERLDRQLDIMKDYSTVLGERIAAFGSPSLTIVP